MAVPNRVANVADGVNQRRITDLSSQPEDENLDQLRIVLVRVFPNALAQLGARENAPRLTHQDLQQHYLPRRKLDPFRATVNIMSGQVERKIANVQGYCRFLRIAVPEGVHPSHQFSNGEGLR